MSRKNVVDPALRKRAYKPVESPLYNLPAGLVDELRDHDLRDDYALAVAHNWLATQPLDDDETAEDREQLLQDCHRALWQQRETAPVIAGELARMEIERRERAEEVQADWTVNHEIKVNNYYLPPLALDRVVSPASRSEPLPILERVSA